MSALVVGQSVTFQGRPSTITKAGAPRRDMFGEEWQPLSVSNYAGTVMIASTHPELEV